MKLPVALLSALVALVLPSIAGAGEMKAKYTAVKFHADYCGSCQKISEFMPALQKELMDQPLLFVEFDFTDDTSKHQSQLLASKLGLGEVYAGNEGTGFILVVDSEGKVLNKIKIDKTAEAATNQAAVAKSLRESIAG